MHAGHLVKGPSLVKLHVFDEPHKRYNPKETFFSVVTKGTYDHTPGQVAHPCRMISVTHALSWVMLRVQ